MMRTRLPLTLGLLLALGGCNRPQGAADGGAAQDTKAEAGAAEAGPGASDAAPASGDVVAAVSAVSGPSGIRTADLAEGTFLGKGAKLRAGQVIQVPRGTLAELSLEGGGTLRINEASELVVHPASDRKVELRSGELVAIVTAGQTPLTIASGEDLLEVSQGEARALNRDGHRDYAVVYGAAKLRSGDKSVDLGPGATLQTPIEEAAPPQPVVSLRPLEDTSWARSFDLAAKMADEVPVGVGALTARRAGETQERYSLRLVDQKVNVTISGRIALTEVEQTFYNEAPLVLEGTYRFPLPADASISGLSLLVGNRWEDAAMLEKERARAIFKEIVEATVPRDPALLEWEQGNIFKLKIFPIPGRGERKIRLRYTQVLPAVGESLRYRYPLSGASSGASGTAIGDFDFKVTIDKGELPSDALAALKTPMADLERREHGDRIELSAHEREFRPVHDLGVDIPLPPEDRRMHAETHLDRDGQAYFMVAVQPDLPLAADDRPTHYAFVLDRSHSTTPELFTAASSLVQAIAGALDIDDRVTILACDTACDAAPGGLQAPTADALTAADAFLRGQTLAGASDLGGMLRSAADALHEADAKGGPAPGERVIVYLGDGTPSAGELAPDELVRHLTPKLEGIRVQSVAMGSRSDLLLLGALADATGGDVIQADAKDNLRDLVRELRLRAAVPVARNVELELPDGMIFVHPSKVGSIRSGDSLVLTGKLSRPVDGPLTVRATGPDGAIVKDTFDVRLVADRADTSGRHAHLPRTWAREEIDELTATQGFAAKKTIIELSKRFTVLSRYTALLVLENDAMYREFNVVRNAGQTDAWKGSLGAPTGGSASSTVQASPDAAAAAEATPPAEAPADGLLDNKRSSRTKDEASTAQEEDASAADKSDRKPMEELEEKAEKESEKAKGAPSRDAFDGDEMAEGEPVDLDDDEDAGPMTGATKSAKPSPAPKSSSSASRPASKMPSSAPKKKAAMDLADPFDGGDFGGGGGGVGYGSGSGAGYGGAYGRGKARIPRIAISTDVAPSSSIRVKLDNLRDQRDRDPSSRAAHRRLVQTAIYYGAPEAFEYARAWAEADPDHAPALLAVADLLAARGEAIAPRAYASAIEVRPFDRKLHHRLADALLSKGDTTRACAHFRALVSIDPKPAANHVDLIRCLGAAGRWDLATDAIVDARGRIKGNQREIDRVAGEIGGRSIAAPKVDGLHSYPDLKATLTWSGPIDMDIAVVDRRGRRLSALRREVIRVREGEGEETLTMQSIDNPVYIEVSRPGGEGRVPPVQATLKIKTNGATRSFDITSDHSTLRLAKVYWTY